MIGFIGASGVAASAMLLTVRCGSFNAPSCLVDYLQGTEEDMSCFEDFRAVPLVLKMKLQWRN